MSEENEEEKKPDSGKDAGLIVEAEAESQETETSDSFDRQLEKTLQETEEAVLGLEGVSTSPFQAKSWASARKLVEEFKPVPWFIWRLSNFVLGKSGEVTNQVPQGMVMGLRRLMFAAASDPVLGEGRKINDVRQALKILQPDVIAAVSVIHAVCRRLASCQFERIWRPILDDALLRARLGLVVGEVDPGFGAGRGMLAGFAGRCGLAILISSGDLDDARKCLEMLAAGKDIRDVGLAIYECDPLQVSAMTLSAAGCGRDAAFGTVSYASEHPLKVISNDYQLKWLAAYTISEKVRVGRTDDVSSTFWEALGLSDEELIDELKGEAKKVVRRGHGWNWLV